jgi:hypothetical protein
MSKESWRSVEGTLNCRPLVRSYDGSTRHESARRVGTMEQMAEAKRA